jgi:hypothetical protein
VRGSKGIEGRGEKRREEERRGEHGVWSAC